MSKNPKRQNYFKIQIIFFVVVNVDKIGRCGWYNIFRLNSHFFKFLIAPHEFFLKSGALTQKKFFLIEKASLTENKKTENLR